MNCARCNNIVLRAEVKEGLCPKCQNELPEVTQARIAISSGRDLLAKMFIDGGIFSQMQDARDMAVQNFLLSIVQEALNQDPRKYKALVERFVDNVIEISGAKHE